MPGRAKTPEERARKRAAALASGHSNPHPHFTAGNTVAMQSGMHSPAVVKPKAEELMAEYLADPGFPEYAKTVLVREQLSNLCTLRVQIRLWTEELERLGTDSGDEVTKVDERVSGSMEKGDFRRSSTAKKRTPPVETYRRLVTTEMNLAKELGLTPMARARMAGALKSSPQQNVAEEWTTLAEAEEAGE